MEYKELLFFKRAAELEHMTKAAEDLGVSQPFLSRSIANLEAEFGVKLFDPAGRGIRLNDYGRALYKYTVKIFNAAEDAKKEIKDLTNKVNKKLLIATNCGMYMPGLLKYIMREVSDFQIQMISLRVRKIEKMLSEGRIDFAIVCPDLSNTREFERVLLMPEEAVIIYPQNHWLKAYSQVELQQIKNEPFIGTAPGFALHDAIQGDLENAGFRPNLIVETTDTSSVVRFVKAGIGIAFSPGTIIIEEPYFRKNHVNLADLELKDKISIYWRKDQYLNVFDRQFVELTEKYFAALSNAYVCARLKQSSLDH